MIVDRTSAVCCERECGVQTLVQALAKRFKLLRCVARNGAFQMTSEDNTDKYTESSHQRKEFEM